MNSLKSIVFVFYFFVANFNFCCVCVCVCVLVFSFWLFAIVFLPFVFHSKVSKNHTYFLSFLKPTKRNKQNSTQTHIFSKCPFLHTKKSLKHKKTQAHNTNTKQTHTAILNKPRNTHKKLTQTDKLATKTNVSNLGNLKT